MNVCVTGAYGRCGTAIIDHLHDSPNYNFTYLNRSDRDWGFDTHLADITNYEAVFPAFDGQDAVIHLAAFPQVESGWEDVSGPNVQGMYNALEAAREAEVETFVFGSTNHVIGMYEDDYAPELYYGDVDLLLDHSDPVRPDSFYGTTKAFGEDLGRQYVELYDYPEQFYALRICSVRGVVYDHPFGDAERLADNGEIERGSDRYEREVARMKAMWQSRQDFAHQVGCCLHDDDVEFGIYNGVSDNDNRWFSLEAARSELGYDPQDNGAEWNELPTDPLSPAREGRERIS